MSLNENNHPNPAKLATIWSRAQTPRLLLRRLEPSDGPAMFRVHGDPETYRFTPVPPHTDLAASEKMLRECTQHWETFGFGYWTITLAGQETTLGFGGVEHYRWQAQEVLNLYYRFTPSAWGQGYATEMAQKAVELAQKYLPGFPIIARTRNANLPSQHVAQKIGLLRLPARESQSDYTIFALGWKHPEHNH